MTGYKSKKAAALDEDGMYLVHHTKRKDDDDDTQVYQRPWVGLTDDEMWSADYGGSKIINLIYAKAIQSKLKERNT